MSLTPLPRFYFPLLLLFATCNSVSHATGDDVASDPNTPNNTNRANVYTDSISNVNSISSSLDNPFADSNTVDKNTPHTLTLLDPTTQRIVTGSYAITVDDYLSLEQAQQVLVQVSPKLASDQAAIVASQQQAAATHTLKQPIVFARAAASTYDIQRDVDLTELKSGLIDSANEFENNLTQGTVIPGLPSFGDLLDERIPDNYEFRRSGHSTSTGIGAFWPIYTAGRTDAITGIADARTQESIADSHLNKNQQYSTLVERYFTAQLAIIAAYLREDAVDTLSQTDHMAQRLFEEGFISHVERLEAQSALADAQSEAVKANNDARLAMMALQRLLRTEQRIKPTTPLFVSSQPLPELSYFQDLALHQHPGFAKVDAKQQQARQLYKLSDTDYKPTVAMFGYADIDSDPSWIAGISATWTFTGGLDKSASRAASVAQMRQAELAALDLSDNLLLLVEKNWHEVNNAQARYQGLQSNVDLAAEVLRLRRLGMAEGVNTAVEVAVAQTQYLKARTEQAQAANDYVQALAALMDSCGTPLAFNSYMNAADIRLPTLYSKPTDSKPAASKAKNNHPLPAATAITD